MKKILGGLLLLSSVGFATSYFAKVEPVNSYHIKATVSGKVIFANSAMESQTVENEKIIKIDDTVNQVDLKQSKLKLKNLQLIEKLEKDTLERFKKVSSKSQFDLDNQRIKILNITSSLNDLETKIATLEDTISNKNLYEKNSYIYDVAVEVGDYVAPGTLLYTAMDLSKGKVEIFIPIEEASSIKKKVIYIDGEKTDLKISKLYAVADSKNISSYKCEIQLPKVDSFSKLVKIEFK